MICVKQLQVFIKHVFAFFQSGSEAKNLFALVTYNDERSKDYARPIRDIKYQAKTNGRIQPINKDDFDPRHKYYIKWYECSNSDGEKCNDDSCKHENSWKTGYIKALGSKKDIHFSLCYR